MVDWRVKWMGLRRSAALCCVSCVFLAAGVPERVLASPASATSAPDTARSVAQQPALDQKQSWIHVTYEKGRLAVPGHFGAFSGVVSFDASRPAAGRVRLEVSVGSLAFKDAAVTRVVSMADWLDIEHFPIARFVSSSIATAGSGKYSVMGRLTLRGKTLVVVVPVSYTESSQGQVFDGVLPIRRQQFGVGSNVDTDRVADKVVLSFHLVTHPAP